jgi:hypothetical protein
MAAPEKLSPVLIRCHCASKYRFSGLVCSGTYKREYFIKALLPLGQR